MSDKLIILPDADFITKLTREFQEQDSQPDTLYVDGHIDLPFYMAKKAPDRIFDDLDTGPVTPETARKSGVRLFAAAICCQDLYNNERALGHFQWNYDFAQKILENAVQVKAKSDISEIKDNRDTVGTIFLLENADVLTNNISLSLSLRDRGIFIAGLTHQGTNRLADGSSVMHSDGITAKGREVVHILQDNNILIDVAHLHPSCFRQLMDLVEVPCVSSHTGIRDRCNLPGNLDLEQVRQIYDRGGLVGITFNPEMLSPDGEADIEDIFIHIDTVVQKFGPGCAALGSGFCGFDTPASGMEDMTGVSGLMKLMKEHGYRKEAIDMIMGLNWLRIYEGLL